MIKQSSGEMRREEREGVSATQNANQMSECCRLILRHCEHSEAIQNPSAEKLWIASLLFSPET